MKSEKKKLSECITGLQMNFDASDYMPKVFLNMVSFICLSVHVKKYWYHYL